ncbi:MAG: ABC transporter ATP-binding protein [Aeriscardovia sp.]|nr:ABC transporter ATP-binding protein [Aeriscardovia sp.]
MASRNTFKQDEELTRSINIHDFARIWSYLRPYTRLLARVLAVVLTMTLIQAVIPYMNKVVIDQIIPHRLTTGLVWLGAGFAAGIAIYELCLRYRTIGITRAGQLMLKDMRRDLFTHVQSLPFSYFDSHPHGKILIRIVNYVNTLSNTLSSGLINIISDVFSFTVTLGAMFLVNWRLALWSLALFPVMAGAVLIIQRFQHAAYRAVSAKQSNLNAFIHESITGVRTTQGFARERSQYRVFQTQQDAVRSSWMIAQYYEFAIWPVVELVSTAAMAWVYYIGVSHCTGLYISTGTLIAFIAYLNNFWDPIVDIGNFYNQLVTCSAYLERIFETLDIPPAIADAPNAVPLGCIRGDVDFDHVVFRYDAEGPTILQDIDLHVKQGQSVALVGPTGAGKSTIVSLLSRFYDVVSGSVRVDGHDVRSVTVQSLRSQMGVMLQDTFLFSGTVKDNIRYGRLDATDEEIVAAAKAVDADGFIRRLPQGYDTMVEEKGSTLSAGQRQLIAFARVMLADPRLLVLDEATSDIDTRTELELQNGIRRLVCGRTSFVIAHRLSTISDCDRIYYIDHGRIVEQGTHKELLAKHGAYWRLFMSQFRVLSGK